MTLLAHRPRSMATVVLSTIAVLAAVALFATPAASGAKKWPSTPACATSRLVVWMTNSSYRLGSTVYKLMFTNFGRRCTLKGFPGVDSVNIGGRQLGRSAKRVNSPKPRLMVLGTGATAVARLQVLDTWLFLFPVSRCRPQPAAGFRVSAPNGRTSKYVAFPFATCAASSRTLYIRPVQNSGIGLL